MYHILQRENFENSHRVGIFQKIERMRTTMIANKQSTRKEEKPTKKMGSEEEEENEEGCD